MNIPRRGFFLLFAGALLRADDLPKRDMLVRSARPEDLEMPPSGFSDYITPIEHFFVRTHVYVPTVNVSEWRLKVEGEVATPLTLTMDDLKKLPSVELVSVLECAGNGRGFYEPPVPGLQWGNGAVGNGRWRGARLVDVLKRAGVKDSAREILFDGADVPLRAMPDFQRSIPVKKAFDGNTLLAYEMNGETLPVKHGCPLRVVAPGWAGDSWVKWLTSVRVLDKEHDGFWMKSAYRHPGKPVAPGTAVPLEQMQPVTSLSVKSVIVAPLDGAHLATNTPLTIRGVAWGGDASPVTAVDVSVDGGRSWKPATLSRNQRTQFGWRPWELHWTPDRESYYTILARARDAVGNLAKFVAPTVANGKVYLATFSNRLNVYGLLPEPLLTIGRAGTNVVLSWPTNTFLNYVLQDNTNLLATNWVTTTNPAVATNGGFQVTIPASRAASFYRLKR